MKKSKERLGKCISSAYEDLIGDFKDLAFNNEAVIVHGWVYSKGLNASIKHAWIEFTKSGIVHEPVSGLTLDKHAQEFFKMRPVKKYTIGEIIGLSVRTKLKGGKFEF